MSPPAPEAALSPVGLGAYPLGGAGRGEDVARGRACLTAARESGCTWVDTGEVYHATANEELLGTIGLDGLAVATKVAPRPAGTGFRPDEVRKACLASLGRLRVDVIDWFYLHWPDDSGVPLEDSWGALRALVDEGLVRRAGLSNFGVDQMRRCSAVGPIDVVQLGLSLVDYRAGRATAKWCGERGVPVTAYEPLANGLLTGAVDATTDLEAWAPRDTGSWPFFQRVLTGESRQRTLAILAVLHTWSRRVGALHTQLALAWALAQPGVRSVLPGSARPEHVRSNARAATLELPADALNALNHAAELASA